MILSLHSILSVINCKHCEKTFTKRLLLTEHMREHKKKIENQFFDCSICKTKFASKRAYTFHKKFHETPNDAAQPTAVNPINRKMFDCSICNKTFSDERNLIQHKKQHTSRVYDCEYCQESFEKKPELKKHVFGIHSHELKTYECNQCSEKFHLESLLKSHSLSHFPKKMNIKTGRFQCEYCPMSLSSNSDLQRHIRTHTGEKRK